MGIPAVTVIERDGNIGQIVSGRLPVAIVGPASGGTGAVLQAQGFSQIRSLAAVHAAGHLYNAAADVMTAGASVFAVRAAASVAGSLSAVTHSGAGTSVVTASGTPTGDWELRARIVTGGTIGVAGITYQLSLDNGRSYGAVLDLGTATSITNARGSGVTLAFAAGTVLAGQTESVLVTGPQSSAGDITAALDVLKANSTQFEVVAIATPMTTAVAAAVDIWIAAMKAIGRDVCWTGAARVPAPAETEATYLAAMTTIFGAYGSTHCVGITAGSVYFSDFDGQFVRPIWRLAGVLAVTAIQTDPAALSNGLLAGYSLVDATGNSVHHNELLSPGLYDARFSVLKSGPSGVGVVWAGARVFSAPGSDFLYPQHRRVLNAVETALRQYWEWILHEGVAVDRTTGKVPEATLARLEDGARDVMTAVLGVGPAASSWDSIADRAADVLRTGRLPVTHKVQPLAYFKSIEITAEYAARIV